MRQARTRDLIIDLLAALLFGAIFALSGLAYSPGFIDWLGGAIAAAIWFVIFRIGDRLSERRQGDRG
ncbi:MAG TPA: hypothetical protein VEX35_02480 [Allosphingosinicella sp.]|nr:hypothetical protein [Allosphingosinicella sp.]